MNSSAFSSRARPTAAPFMSRTSPAWSQENVVLVSATTQPHEEVGVRGRRVPVGPEPGFGYHLVGGAAPHDPVGVLDVSRPGCPHPVEGSGEPPEGGHLDLT